MRPFAYAQADTVKAAIQAHHTDDEPADVARQHEPRARGPGSCCAEKSTQ